MKASKTKFKGGIFKLLAVLAIVILVAMLLQIPFVSDYVAKVTGSTGDKIRSVARTIASLAIGVALVTWGIASLAVPILGVGMILAGLALVAYSLWPLFRPSSAQAQSASFDNKNLFKVA